MRKHIFIRPFQVIFLICITLTINAQQKQITLEEIWDGSFSPKKMQVLRSMNDGLHYTVLKTNAETKTSSIEKYDYKTSELIETLVSSEMPNVPYFTSYSFH